MTWFGDIRVNVAADGGGPVEDVTVKLSRMKYDGSGTNVIIDETYREFLEEETDAYGETVLKVRVQDSDWTDLTQHFRVEVTKTSQDANGKSIQHSFVPDVVGDNLPAFTDLKVQHLGETTFEFTDTTVNVISGTVSHAGFGAAYFAADCPHKKSEDTGECMCPVDGAKVFVIRDSGEHEEVTVNDGKFATAVRKNERVTLYLGRYYGVGVNSDCEKEGTSTHESGNTLRCIELPDKSLVDVLEVENGTPTCGHTDANSCPAGYDIWVPRSYEHAQAVYDLYKPGSSADSTLYPGLANKGNLPNLVGVYREQHGTYPETISYAMKSDDSDAVTAGWRSVAGSPWFLRSTAYTSGGTTEPDGGTSAGNYQAGSWITITGWDDTLGFQFDDAPILPNQNPEECFTNYLCSRAGLHEFSVIQESGTIVPPSDIQQGVLPSFTYTANADAEVHFLDITNQTLSARLVLGASATPASYVSGLPIVASVERCDWEMPAWTLQGVANFELGAAAFEVRTLGPDEVDEAKYYYPYGDLSNTDQEFAVLDCDDTTLSRAVMFSSTDDRMLRGCRAKIPEVRECDEDSGETPANEKCQNETLPCATMDHTYVDELPETRNFAVDLSYLGTSDVTAVTTATAAPTMTPMPTFSPAPTAVPTSSPTTMAGGTAAPVTTVDFEIISPLCLDSVTVSSSGNATDGETELIAQKLIDPGVGADGKPLLRESAYPIDAQQEGMLLLSELPEPEEDGLYGKACTENTGAIFREGDVVELEFKLVEREPLCLNPDVDLYPWDDCGKYKNVDSLLAHDSPPTDRQVKIRVADGVSGIDDSGEYAGTETFKHIMTAGKPNPFAPFSHELSVEFTRAFDGAKILFVRHVLVVGSIPEEVPQVWTAATNPTLIFSIIRDPPGGESTATLVEGSTISTSMAIDGAHAAQLADNWEFGFSIGGSVKLASTFGILKNIASVHGGAGVVYSETPTDVTVSRSTSRHFDIGISFSVGISTSDSPYIAGQPSDVIIGGGANLRFISAIEIYAKASGSELCLGGLTALEFLPEKISTWVMSVYEIEKTIERIGAALTDPNTKIEGEKDEHGNIVTDPRADLVKQIENWRTVLANYRAATMKDQAMSVANQLERELDSIHANFQSFLKEATTGGTGTIQFSDFLSHGLNKMEERKLHYLETGGRSHSNLDSVPGGTAAGKQAEGDVWVYEQSRLKRYENDVLDRVNSVYSDCVGSVEFVEPGGEARLCDVYHNISAKLELKSSLFGICDFKDGHASVKKLRTVLNSTAIFDRPRVTVCIRPNLDSAQVLRERPLSDGGNRRRKHDQRLRRAI